MSSAWGAQYLAMYHIMQLKWVIMGMTYQSAADMATPIRDISHNKWESLHKVITFVIVATHSTNQIPKCIRKSQASQGLAKPKAGIYGMDK